MGRMTIRTVYSSTSPMISVVRAVAWLVWSRSAAAASRNIRPSVQRYLPGGDVVRLVEQFQPPATGCRLDTGLLAAVAKRVATAIADGSDLVIINRFGRSESEGRGLTDLITRALDADIPVLLAVPERRFAACIKFSDGMNVRLACRHEALERWWQSLTGSITRGEPNCARTFCEIG